ncbi:MAG TPA: hypothetical protein VLV50_19405 [Stellaceae bacterium]|nr:hypothetical protein [Stellaceae bacterium]
MTKFTTLMAAALLTGASSLAMAQGLSSDHASGATQSGTSNYSAQPGSSTGMQPGTSATPNDSAQPRASSRMDQSQSVASATQVKQLLQRQGYTSVQSIHKQTNGSWSAKAKKNGEQMSLKVAQDGTVTPQS